MMSWKTAMSFGGKTGYTPEAGYCLASVCEIQGREVISHHRRVCRMRLARGRQWKMSIHCAP